MAAVDVTDGDVHGVDLTLRPAVHLRGRVQFDTASGTRPPPLQGVRVTLGTIGPTFMSVTNGTQMGHGGLPSRCKRTPMARSTSRA